MGKKIPEVLVICGDDEQVRRTGERICAWFTSQGKIGTLREARATIVPHAAAARLFILGAQGETTAGYEEIERSFAGVNFAGRWAAFFFVGSGRAETALPAMLRDTDAYFYSPPLVMDPLAAENGEAVEAWCAGLLAEYRAREGAA